MAIGRGDDIHHDRVWSELLNDDALQRGLEAVLFVADGPVAITDLARALDAPTQEIEAALARLGAACNARGLRIARAGNRVQMTTAPETSLVVERFLGIDGDRSLSQAALETLAIIAYRQPITRAQIEDVRGVNSDAVIRTLIARQLVEAVDRLPQAGRPLLYGTTLQFLQYFGIPSLDDLPSLPELELPAGFPEAAPEDGETDP
ncbi:MAG: SMC-Scp complex subunit ScpB [Anaerolineae bacterium]|nr:SMC-Scp complex subunit ScpB [Anaerolineae bacterium]